MKHKLQLFTAFLCGAIFFSGVSYAATELIAKPVDFKITVNGVEQKLNNKPVLINNSAFLPLRAVGEITGYDVGFNNTSKTISLKNEEGNAVNNEVVSEASNNSNNSKYTFRTLPMTKEGDGLTVTVHSMTVLESHTEFEITVTNNLGWDRQINFRSGFVYNYNVNGKNMEMSGTVDEGVFKNEIKTGESLTGILKKGVIPSDADNVILRASTKGIEFPYFTKLK